MNIKEAGWKIFSLQREEVSFTIPLFFLYLFSGIFFATGQVYTESLFLQTYGALGLSRFFAINGVVLFLSGFIYTYFLELFSLKKSYILLIILFCCIPGSTWLPASWAPHDPLFLFVGNYIATFYLDAHFINFSFQFLTLQSSKRIFPFLMAGSKLGGIIITIIISIYSTFFIQYAAYIWLAAGILILIPFFATAKINHKSTHSISEHTFLDKLSTLFSSRMFVVSAVAVFIMAIANQHTEYFFARIATYIYPSQEQLAVFISRYTFITDFTTVAIQLFVTSRIIKKLSIPTANLLYPSSYCLIILFAVLSPTLLAAVGLRFFRKNMSFFIRQPVSNIMLSINPPDRVNQARSIINGIISPSGMIAGGLLLSLYASLPLEIIIMLSFIIGLLFVAVTIKQNALYKEAIYFKLQPPLPVTLHISNSDITDIVKNPRLHDKSEFIDTLLHHGMSAEMFPFIIQYYDSLSEKTKIHLMSIIYEAPEERAIEISKKAINDENLLVRVYAFRFISQCSLAQRKEILHNHKHKLPIERFIQSLLTDNNSYCTDTITHTLNSLEQSALNNHNAGIEFLMLCSVIDPPLFIQNLYRLAMGTGNSNFFQFITLYADLLPQSQSIRIFYRFRFAPLDVLEHFLTKANINPALRLMLCDYRFDLPVEMLSSLFSVETDYSILENRLIQKRAYCKKANYLNVFIALNILPKENLPLFINASIARIHQQYQCRAALATIQIDKLFKDFLAIIFNDVILYEKNLLFKALALSTGTHVDIAYESNLLLKDVEIENYIIEFLTLTQKGKQLALLENYTAKDVAPIPLPLFIKNCKYLRSCMPALSKQLDYCIELINTMRSFKEDNVSQTIQILTFLKQNALFKETTVDQLVHLIQIARTQKLPENTEFIKEGETGDELFIIMDGEVNVTRSGKEIARLSIGDCIGELSIIDKEPRSATVKTTKQSLLLSLNRNDFLLTLKSNPTIAINVMKVIADRLRSTLSHYNL